MKNKLYHTVRTVLKSILKIDETEAKSIPSTHICMIAHYLSYFYGPKSRAVLTASYAPG
jgi:hypothetical protein